MSLTFKRRCSATILALISHFKVAQYVDFYQWTPSSLLMTLVIAIKCSKALDYRTLQDRRLWDVFVGHVMSVFVLLLLQVTLCCGILEVFISQLFSYTKDDGVLTWPVLIILALKCTYWLVIYVKFASFDNMMLRLITQFSK